MKRRPQATSRVDYAFQHWGPQGVDLVLGRAPGGWWIEAVPGAPYFWGCPGCGAHALRGRRYATTAALDYATHLSVCPFPGAPGGPDAEN